MTVVLQSDRTGIARAAALLRAGELVAFGTETVYGLGADATNDRARWPAVFAAKGRPHFNPLICHYPDAEAAFGDVDGQRAGAAPCRGFLAGAVEFGAAAPARLPVRLLAGAGLDTLAVRVPRTRIALALLRAVGRPVAAPSANRSGQISPTTARHVLDGLAGRIAAVLDSGPCPVGVEFDRARSVGGRPVLLRPGGVTVEAIEALVGRAHHGDQTQRRGVAIARAAGLALCAERPVRLDAVEVRRDEALLAYGPPVPGAGALFRLSDTADLTEAAGRLFAGLRQLDADAAALGLVQDRGDAGSGARYRARDQRPPAPCGRAASVIALHPGARHRMIGGSDTGGRHATGRQGGDHHRRRPRHGRGGGSALRAGKATFPPASGRRGSCAPT